MSASPQLGDGFFPVSCLMQAGGDPPPIARPASFAPRVDYSDANVQQPGIQLAEFRRFRAADKEYVFIPAVTAVFAIGDLSGQILESLRPSGGTAAAATDALQLAATRHATLSEVLGRFEPEHERSEIVEALKELRSIGALRFVGFRNEGLRAPAPKTPPVPFPQRTLVLNVANDCNLGCGYCFAAQGGYGSPRQMMNEETAQRSVEFLLANSENHKSVTLVFFGGEPLMNLNLIRRVVNYAGEAGRRAGKEIEFTITTNATCLTSDVIRFLSDNRIGVSVSIDGPKEYHDLRRTYRNGRGSYDVIRPRVMQLLREHTTRPVAARATLTRGVTAVQECFWHLRGMGFREVGFAPVTSAPKDDYALTPEDLWTVLADFRQLAKAYVEAALRGEYLGFSNLSNVMAGLHAGIVKTYPCGAGLGLLGVGAGGGLYLCHRFSESPEHRMGSVEDGLDRDKQQAFLDRAHVNRKPSCRTCWVRHVCSGGCHHEAYMRHGAIHEPNAHYCEWIRTWIDIGLKCYAEIMDKNPKFIERFIETRGI